MQHHSLVDENLVPSLILNRESLQREVALEDKKVRPIRYRAFKD